MPELDGESNVRRHLVDEIDQRGQLTRIEIRPELHQNGTKFVTQLAGALVEELGHSQLVAEALLMGDFLRELEREDEIVRRSVVPALERRGRGNSVKRRIDFDGSERPRIN